jgi:hypothetical protein
MLLGVIRLYKYYNEPAYNLNQLTSKSYRFS